MMEIAKQMESPVYLRALEPEDLDLLYSIENDTGIWDVCDNPTPYSRFAIRQYLSAQPQDIYQSRELRLVIVETNTNEAVGTVDLVNFSPLDLRAEVSIALLQQKRGLGLGRFALKKMEDYAAHFLHMRLLYAIVSESYNPVAQHLFKSLGYNAVALLPQWHKRGCIYEDVEILQKKIEKKAR